MLDACRPAMWVPAAPKMQAGLMHLFEDLHLTHCGKEGKCMAAAVGEVCLPTKAQVEAEARVRTLEDKVQQLLSGVCA